jgi:O-antigen/teichoic acid export membrane protein
VGDDKRARMIPHEVAARLMIAQLITAGTAFGINVLSARSLGPGGRGALAFYLQLSYLLGVLCITGLDQSYPASRAVPSRPDTREASGEVLRLAALPVALCVGLIMVAALPSPFGAGWSLAFAVALSLTVVGGLLTTTLRTAAIAAGNASVFLAVIVVSQAALLATTSVYTATAVDSPLAWLTTYGVTALVPAMILLLVRRPRPRPQFAAVRRRERLAGLALMPSTIAYMVTLRSDRLLLPAFAGVEALGLYIIVATVTETMGWPAQAYIDANVPIWARAHEHGTLRPRLICTVSLGYVAVAVTAVGLVTQALVVPVFGEAYQNSVTLVWPLAAAAGLDTLSRVGVGLSVARSQPLRVAVVEFGAMIVSIAAYLLMIPGGGAHGAAWACVIGYGTGAVLAATAALTPGAPGGRGPRVPGSGRGLLRWSSAATEPGAGSAPVDRHA